MRALAGIICCMMLALSLSATAATVLTETGPAPEELVLDSLGIVWAAREGELLNWDGRTLVKLDIWDGWEGGAVYKLVADSRNRVWLSADSGLFLHDEEFKRINLQSAVAGGRGRALLPVRESIWLATEQGLLVWHPLLGERVLLAGSDVRCLAELPGGDILCGTLGHGLLRFDVDGVALPLGNLAGEQLSDVLFLAMDERAGVRLLGRTETGSLQLATLDDDARNLRYLRDRQLPAGLTQPNGLVLLDGNLLLKSGDDWLKQDQSGGWRKHHASGGRLLMPEGWADAWPGLATQQLPGSLIEQLGGGGMLVALEEGMRLVWKPTGDAASALIPLQYCKAGNSSWLLLEDAKGRRRLFELDGAGVRDHGPALENLKTGPSSICADRQADRLLIAAEEGLFHYDGQLQPAARWTGASWLEPFAANSILVAGDDGLALLEEGRLLPLRVRERVLKAVPDAFGGILAACNSYLLRLNELNEVDTLRYPSSHEGRDTWPGEYLRSMLSDRAGRIWLLSENQLLLKSRDGVPWTHPYSTEQGQRINSMALDKQDRLWISTSQSTGFLLPDRTPPVLRLDVDPGRPLAFAPDLQLKVLAADPPGPSARPLYRFKLDGRAWSRWMEDELLPLGTLLASDMPDGPYRLQLQAVDAWGNLSRNTASQALQFGSESQRLPFIKRLLLLSIMVMLSVLATLAMPGRGGMLFSLLSGLAVGAWIFFTSDEPLLWWALPVIQVLSSRITSDQLKTLRKRENEPAGDSALTDLVDRFREFGHSGSSTRNIDRLLRSSRNLYLDGVPDPEINGRFQTSRGVFLDLTSPSLEGLHDSFKRLRAEDSPVTEAELEMYHDLIQEVDRLLESCGDPPEQVRLEELAFQLDRLEKMLGDLEHRVDLKISSSPLKVLDRVLEHRAPELSGVELSLKCERDTRQVLARLPVDKLQFILDNLVDNALYWMRGKDLQLLEIIVTERPSTLQLRVSDTGPGVPENKRDTIFQAGFSERDHGEGGSGGYGLYRSRELLARYGGSLELEETGPEGSTFLLEVKKVEAESA